MGTRKIEDHALTHLDRDLAQFAEEAARRGVHVHVHAATDAGAPLLPETGRYPSAADRLESTGSARYEA